jgi:hypothetical protein
MKTRNWSSGSGRKPQCQRRSQLDVTAAHHADAIKASREEREHSQRLRSGIATSGHREVPTDHQKAGASNATATFSRFEIVKVRTSMTAAITRSSASSDEQQFGESDIHHERRGRRRGFQNRNQPAMTSEWLDVAGVDVLIVGGGIAGASLGAELAPHRSVLLVEAESQCGVHSTGRSAAFWLESLWRADVARADHASRGFLAEPPGETFPNMVSCATRGDLHISRSEALPELSNASAVERFELERLVPGIRSEWTCAPCSSRLRRHRRRRDFTLRICAAQAFRGRGPDGFCSRPAKHEAAAGEPRLRDGNEIEAGVIVNAAGAWADPVARACGRRAAWHRSEAADDGAASGRPLAGMSDLPLVIDDAEGKFLLQGGGRPDDLAEPA